ncbi:MAG: hypothetical protein J2P48_17170 [Alphaproteobacteria bacterium]|nr:hypothetical protein [Alphaproteobacteria bacterium]
MTKSTAIVTQTLPGDAAGTHTSREPRGRLAAVGVLDQIEAAIEATNSEIATAAEGLQARPAVPSDLLRRHKPHGACLMDS